MTGETSKRVDLPPDVITAAEDFGLALPEVRIRPLLQQRLARHGYELTVDPLSLLEGTQYLELEDTVKATIWPKEDHHKKLPRLWNADDRDTLRFHLTLDHDPKTKNKVTAATNNAFWLGVVKSARLSKTPPSSRPKEARKHAMATFGGIAVIGGGLFGGLLAAISSGQTEVSFEAAFAVSTISGALIASIDYIDQVDRSIYTTDKEVKQAKQMARRFPVLEYANRAELPRAAFL